MSGLVQRLQKLVLLIRVHGNIGFRIREILVGDLTVKFRQRSDTLLVHLFMQARQIAKCMGMLRRFFFLALLTADILHKRHDHVTRLFP